MKFKSMLYYLSVAVFVCLFCGLSMTLFVEGLTSFAVVFAILAGTFAIIFINPKLYNYRFMFPGLSVLTLVILIPIGLLIKMSFETYRDASYLDYNQAKNSLLSATFLSEDSRSYQVAGISTDNSLTLYLQDETSGEWWYANINLDDHESIVPLSSVEVVPVTDFDNRIAVQYRELLGHIKLSHPTGDQLVKNSLRRFSTRQPRYEEVDRGLFLDRKNGDLIQADASQGQFTIIESSSVLKVGQLVPPLFISFAGVENYRRIVSEDSHSRNLFKIIPWNILSATLTVSASLFIALVSASLLSWEALKGRELFKTVIVACFAFPAFAIISAFWTLLHGDAVLSGTGVGTVFMGPGILNQILSSLLGISPDWLSDPVLSRLSFLMTQFWLTMPLMFILCLGTMPSIPRNIYEAAKLEGAGVCKQFLSITAPLVIRQLAPVLIIIFALAFNDMALVNMLFRGWLVPTIENSTPIALHTDLIVSYANRFALGGDASYQQAKYSLGAALFTMLFIFIGMLSLIYLKVSKTSKAELTEKV